MSHVATICPHCQTENHHHGADCVKCHGSLAQAPGSPFSELTLQGLETLRQRLDDAVGSAITTAGTAQRAGEEELSGKLSLMSTTLNAISERVKAMREKMANK